MSLRFLVESHFARVRADSVFWRQHIEEIARRHNLSMQTYEPTLGDATNAVFFVGDAVVKVYTPFFHGRESKGIEPAVLRAIAGADASLPIPRVKAHGDLLVGSSDWNWPYAVMSRVRGRVLDVDWPTMEFEVKASILRDLGRMLARIHAIPPSAELGEIYRRLWPHGFQGFLGKQLDALKMHPELAVLPIADEVRDLTVSPMGPAWPKILHGDLEPAHLFHQDGALVSLIDFGDAKLGDPLYDFVLIRKAFTNGDRELMNAFFDGYGNNVTLEEEARGTLTLYTLLHEWVSIKDLSKWIVKSGSRTLRDLGEWLWKP